MDRLSLKLIPIDVKTSTAVPTADYINILVDAAVNIKISSDSERLSVAAENFLNQDTDYIARVAREVLELSLIHICSLEVGKDADLVLFDQNPVVSTAAKALLTMVDGEVVYRR